jgi:hypothetical protein
MVDTNLEVSCSCRRCRRAAEIAEAEAAKQAEGAEEGSEEPVEQLVQMEHITAAVKELFGEPHMVALRTAGPHAKVRSGRRAWLWVGLRIETLGFRHGATENGP